MRRSTPLTRSTLIRRSTPLTRSTLIRRSTPLTRSTLITRSILVTGGVEVVGLVGARRRSRGLGERIGRDSDVQDRLNGGVATDQIEHGVGSRLVKGGVRAGGLVLLCQGSDRRPDLGGPLGGEDTLPGVGPRLAGPPTQTDVVARCADALLEELWGEREENVPGPSPEGRAGLGRHLVLERGHHCARQIGRHLCQLTRDAPGLVVIQPPRDHGLADSRNTDDSRHRLLDLVLREAGRDTLCRGRHRGCIQAHRPEPVDLLDDHPVLVDDLVDRCQPHERHVASRSEHRHRRGDLGQDIHPLTGRPLPGRHRRHLDGTADHVHDAMHRTGARGGLQLHEQSQPGRSDRPSRADRDADPDADRDADPDADPDRSGQLRTAPRPSHRIPPPGESCMRRSPQRDTKPSDQRPSAPSRTATFPVADIPRLRVSTCRAERRQHLPIRLVSGSEWARLVHRRQEDPCSPR
ncbi:MAG: DUF963 domain-containing protein [Intrasporangiaceae bacterium]|nr:DUF963 domain-containing protein [Intrasporangiaceae bacterium]